MKRPPAAFFVLTPALVMSLALSVLLASCGEKSEPPTRINEWNSPGAGRPANPPSGYADPDHPRIIERKESR